MLEAPPGLVLPVAGQVHLAVLSHDLATAVHQDGGVVAHLATGFLCQLGVAQVEAHTHFAR